MLVSLYFDQGVKDTKSYEQISSQQELYTCDLPWV